MACSAARRRDATKESPSIPSGIAPAKDMNAWIVRSKQRYSTGTPAATSRSAYAFPSSRNGSQPAVSTSAGGRPARSLARSGDTRGPHTHRQPLRGMDARGPAGSPRRSPRLRLPAVKPGDRIVGVEVPRHETSAVKMQYDRKQPILAARARRVDTQTDLASRYGHRAMGHVVHFSRGRRQL